MPEVSHAQHRPIRADLPRCVLDAESLARLAQASPSCWRAAGRLTVGLQVLLVDESAPFVGREWKDRAFTRDACTRR